MVRSFEHSSSTKIARYTLLKSNFEKIVQLWIFVESYQRLKKMVLDASLLNTQHYKVWIKGKVEQPREGVAPSHTPWCSSYRKWDPSGHPRLWSPTLLTMDLCKNLLGTRKRVTISFKSIIQKKIFTYVYLF